MSDLLITIDATKSKKNRFIVISTYYTGKVTVNNSGKYRGSSISEADAINCEMVDNCDYKFIRRTFNELCFPVSLNEYYISIDNLNVLFDRLAAYSIFFWDQDRSLSLINAIVHSKIRRKTKKTIDAGVGTLSYGSDCIMTIEDSSNIEKINIIEPTPRLYYDKEKKIYALFFGYAGTEVPYMDKRLSVASDGIIYPRNINYEIIAERSIEKEKFTKLAKNRFIYSGHDNTNKLNDKLSGVGIMLENDDNVLIPQIKVKRSDAGWFEIGLDVNVNGKMIDLASRMNLFASKNEIEIDGKKVILPDSIIDAKKDIVADGNKIKVNQANLFSLLHIIYDSGENISDFFSYSDVALDLPEHVLNVAYPYQIDGIKWLKFLFLNRIGGCLADDMGLGKTFQIISFLSDSEVKSKIDKVLIIVPKSLLTNWKKEFEKFLSDYSVGIYHGEGRNEAVIDKYNVVITTYNTAHIDKDLLNHRTFSLIVFDEIQTVKNSKSMTSNSMKELKAMVRFGLSGTPMENNISELWNVMDIINPGMFSSQTSFIRRYNGKNYDELKSILNLFIMRRLKKDVLKELPEKTEQIIYCDMDQKQRELYISIKLAVKNAIVNLKAFSAPVVLKGLTLLRECCCAPALLDEEVNVDRITDSCKQDSLSILIDDLFASGHKILVFSSYTSMLKLIKLGLENKKEYQENIFYLDGKTKDRSALVEQFESATQGIFLISIKAGGVGLNLVSAQDVIIYDPWWNPFVEQQAIDRAYRIGQENPVSVYKMVVADTIEERIIDMQKNKEKDFDELLNGLSTDKNIDINKIIELL